MLSGLLLATCARHCLSGALQFLLSCQWQHATGGSEEAGAVLRGERQGQRADLQVKLAMAVPDDAGGETGGRGALARGVHSDGGRLGGKLEELRLGRGRISKQQNIDVTAPPCAVRQLLQAGGSLSVNPLRLSFLDTGNQAGTCAVGAACDSMEVSLSPE